METKLLQFLETDLKLRDDGLRFAGYATSFNGVDSYGDTVLPGAFAESITGRSRPVRMHYNHDYRTVIGKWTNIAEDAKGLLVEGELTPGHSIASDVRASLKHGTVDGLSIGFRVPPGGAVKAGRVRQLKRIDLVEVSVVTTPADLGARILPDTLKSALDSMGTIRDVEAILREAGWSRNDAAHFIKQCKIVFQGEPATHATHATTEALVSALNRFRVIT